MSHAVDGTYIKAQQDKMVNSSLCKKASVDTYFNVIEVNLIIYNDDVIMMNKDTLTIDYVPINAYSVRPASQYIKVKAIIRNYDKNSEAPYIENITIKKFGGSSLWEIS